MPKGNPMNRTEWMAKISIAFVLALFAMGCSQDEAKAPAFNQATGKHPAGWMQIHWVEYTKNPDQCATCHGSATDPAQAGGVSKVSCFTCHPSGPGHPDGWAAPGQHGRLGAQAAPSENTGFASCFRCHGSGSSSSQGRISTSCVSCHAKAPHPSKPWRHDSATSPNHDATDPGNAAACYTCHANGAHSTLVPSEPAPAGTTPGCYNNTMCHGRTF